MNFGPTHFVQTASCLKRDPKRTAPQQILHCLRSCDRKCGLYDSPPTEVFSPRSSASSVGLEPEEFTALPAELQILAAYKAETLKAVKRIRDILDGSLAASKVDSAYEDLARYLANFQGVVDPDCMSFRLMEDVITSILSMSGCGHEVAAALSQQQGILLDNAEQALQKELSLEPWA